MEPWRRTVARGLLLILVTSIAAVIVANIAGFVAPIVAASNLTETSDIAAQVRSAMSWVALVSVVATAVLVVGTWWATSVAPDRDRRGPWRVATRILVILSLGLHVAHFATGLLGDPASHQTVGVALVLGNDLLILAGLMWLRELSVLLGSPGLARNAGWAVGAYLLVSCVSWVTRVAFDESGLVALVLESGLAIVMGVWIWALIGLTRRAALSAGIGEQRRLDGQRAQ